MQEILSQMYFILGDTYNYIIHGNTIPLIKIPCYSLYITMFQ